MNSQVTSSEDSIIDRYSWRVRVISHTLHALILVLFLKQILLRYRYHTIIHSHLQFSLEVLGRCRTATYS